MTNLSEYFNAKGGTENTIKLINGNESFISRARTVTFVKHKNKEKNCQKYNIPRTTHDLMG
jgi:hypothetical protein